MSDNPIGKVIGDETYADQKAAGDDFLQNLPPDFMSRPLEEQKAINAAFAKLVSELAGFALARHTLVWERISFDPTTTDEGATPPRVGLDRPVPSTAQQINDSNTTLALWLKTGPNPTDWTPFVVGGARNDHKVAVDSVDDLSGNADYLQVKIKPSSTVEWTKDGNQLRADAIIDHLVKARTADATAVGGLQEKTKPGRNVAISLINDNGVEKLLFDVNTVEPAAAKSYLYTARTTDPLDRGQVLCCFLGPHFAGGNTPMLEGWNQPEPGVFVAPTTGALPPEWLDGVDTLADDATLRIPSPLLGKRFLAYYQGDVSEHGTEEQLQQVLILEDAGAHWEPTPGHPETLLLVNTYARFRRAPGYTQSSDYVHGMTFGIQTGNRFGASFLTLGNTSVASLGTTPLVWNLTSTPTYSWNYGHELLSSSQLMSEAVDPSTVDMSVTMASGSPGVPGVAYMSYAFTTLPGTPNIVKLAKGAQLFQFERISLSTSDLTGSTQILARILITDATGSVEITELSPTPAALLTPNTTVDNFQLPYTLADDIDMTTIQRFVLLVGVSTTCTTPATLTVRMSSPLHGTWWKGTFQLDSVGSTTAPRSKDVSVGDLYGDGPEISSEAILGELGQSTPAWGLPHGSTNSVTCTVQVPQDATGLDSVTVRPVWSPGSSSSGQVRWGLVCEPATGVDITAVQTPVAWTGDAHPFMVGTPVLEAGYSTGSFKPAPGTWLRISVVRLGADGSDTYVGQANIIGLQIDYIATLQMGGVGDTGPMPTVSGTGWAHVTGGAWDSTASTPNKNDVGLGNVDNTSDANKPVSTATATALAGKLSSTDPSVTNARTPTAHASSHTTGSDQIADATPTTHGLESAADKSKLDGIEAGATVGADWNTNVANKPTLGTAASHAATDFDASGAAATVQSSLNTHTSATGTAVHGLGTAATHAASDFDSSGAAAGVQTNLTTHASATGTAVHGLGSAATHAATDFDAAGAAAAAQTAAQAASLPLHGTADAVAGATFTKNLTVDTGNVTIHGDAAGSALTVGATASVSGTNTGDETHSTVMTKVADPAPSGKFLRDDGTYQTVSAGGFDPAQAAYFAALRG